ncbi:MAG: bifunctional 5,10-methylenetetrahydrofolate dehydrogenase/5,10-methenyltetrahydrofolate cyclohydrolase [Syntrophomonadaceae bacterium]|nr:bifunctional 5,10-methylenetetrahydrofolate dehydrogenase/5,10-methenyltetrahydrofolate cyclohydrolase [Syntrophomonadaceae bacterium]
MNQVLYGKKIVDSIIEGVSADIERLQKAQIFPGLVTVQVGEDPAAEAFLVSQMNSAKKLGINSRVISLPESASQSMVADTIQKLNQDPEVHGIMLHVPLPEHLNSQALQWMIDRRKDVEGVTPYNLGRLLIGKPVLVPCTALSVVELIKSTGVRLRGKEATMIGRSDIVGKPVSLMLTKLDCTVTLCHQGTSEAEKLEEHVRRADILVVSVGRPNFVTGNWVKPGAIVIDVGINYVNNKMAGDVEFETAVKKAGFITPVPGGVGGVTVAYLWKNLIDAVDMQIDREE